MQLLSERWRRLWQAPELWTWLPAGLAGGITGGAGVAWVFWGWPNLLGSGTCFPLWLVLGVVAFAFACAAGAGVVFLIQWLVKILRRFRTPPALAMWEPAEPVAELDQGIVSTPGCAVALYLPLICVCGAVALGLVILALWHVAFWRVIGLMALGLPFGVAMARAESRRHTLAMERQHSTGEEYH